MAPRRIFKDDDRVRRSQQARACCFPDSVSKVSSIRIGMVPFLFKLISRFLPYFTVSINICNPANGQKYGAKRTERDREPLVNP